MKATLTLEDGRTIEMELTQEQQKALEVKKAGRWKPELGEKYWYPQVKSVIASIELRWENDNADKNLYKHGLVFKTKEEAQLYLEKREFIVEVNDKIDELNDGWKPDWSKDNTQYKYYLNSNGTLRVNDCVSYREANIFHYMKSEEIAEQIIEEFKDGLLKYIFN